MWTIIGDVELQRDYEKFVCEHFERVKCCPMLKKLEKSTIFPRGKEDSIFKVASILDIIEMHIFNNVDEKTKGGMILACKYWAQRLLPI